MNQLWFRLKLPRCIFLSYFFFSSLCVKSNKNRRSYNVKSNPTCTNGTALSDYFNNPAVKSALHVDPTITWTLCADDLNYVTTVQDVSQVRYTGSRPKTSDSSKWSRLWLKFSLVYSTRSQCGFRFSSSPIRWWRRYGMQFSWRWNVRWSPWTSLSQVVAWKVWNLADSLVFKYVRNPKSRN